MADARRVAIVPLPVVRDPTLSDNAKIVALGIGAFMFADGTCHPGTAALGTLLSRSPASVYRGLAELIAKKHLTRTRHGRRVADLQWQHPMIGQAREVREAPISQTHHSNLSDQRKNRPPTSHKKVAPSVDRARGTRTNYRTRTTGNEKKKNLLSEDEKKPTAPDVERPVFDLTRRQDREQPPAPLAASLTHFLTRPGG